MKPLITLIILLSIATLKAQPLMLSVRKATVIAEMRTCRDFKRTRTEADYLEYQKGEITIAYVFAKNKHKWLCSSASITMPENKEASFIVSKTGCHCWEPIDYDSWLYETNHFDAPVLVKRTATNGCATFTYSF
jgi:hypothetical protein